MLETIFEWLLNAIGEGVEAVVNTFMGLLELDIGNVAAQFPFLTRTYGTFRIIGIGLVVVFASVSIFKFAFGPMAENSETPLQVLFRAALAIGMIYFGGYILEWVVNIVKLPYDYFLNMDAVTSGMPTDSLGDFAGELNNEIGFSVGLIVAGGIPGLFLGAAATLLLSLVMVIVIFINLIKLIVEVAQRFMWLFVMLYTAPLAFSTYSSKSTSEIFRKWVSMFASQCLLMVMSVWLLKAAVSGFSCPADANLEQHNFLFQFLMTLALCKIGANIDREIQRIGLNPATASGNVLDEIKGTFNAVMQGVAGGGRSSGGEQTLGKTFIDNAGDKILGGATAIANRVTQTSHKAATMQDLREHPFATIRDNSWLNPNFWKNGNDSGSATSSSAGGESSALLGGENASGEQQGPSDKGSASDSNVTGGRTTQSIPGRHTVGEVFKAHGATLGTMDRTGEPIISAPTPQQQAAAFVNSIGARGQSEQVKQAMGNTAKHMTPEGARTVFGDATLNNVQTGKADATLGPCMKTALGQSGMGHGSGAYFSDIGIARDKVEGTVRTTAKMERKGQVMDVQLFNKPAYEQLTPQERVGFSQVSGMNGELYFKREMSMTPSKSPRPSDSPTGFNSPTPPAPTSPSRPAPRPSQPDYYPPTPSTPTPPSSPTPRPGQPDFYPPTPSTPTPSSSPTPRPGRPDYYPPTPSAPTPPSQSDIPVDFDSVYPMQPQSSPMEPLTPEGQPQSESRGGQRPGKGGRNGTHTNRPPTKDRH